MTQRTLTRLVTNTTFSLLASLTLISGARAQMVSGPDMPGFQSVFGLAPAQTTRNLKISPLSSSQLTNIVWPGESIDLQLLLENQSDKARVLKGTMRVIGYRTSVPPGDIWKPQVFKVVDGPTAPISVTLSAKGSTQMVVKPTIPAAFGAYGIVLDFGKEGRAWAGTVARVVKPEPGKVWNPAYAIDMPWPFEISIPVSRTFLKLGVKGCRMGASYTPTTSPEFESSLAELTQHLKWAGDNNISVMLTIGAGSAPQPLGRGRPWLKADGTLIEGVKEDLAWLPAYDEDFRKWTKIVCDRFGWPKGPVNAVELWNEPWEGVSISGWGADSLRYREMYKQMGLGVFDARKAGAKVMIGGASSSSNTLDKLFPDGSTEFLDMLDFVSIHYQGVGAVPSLIPMWIERKGEYGMVQNWDTESWVANSEDRIPGVVGSMLSFGQQRAMGTYAGNTFQATSYDVGGKNYRGVQAWSLAPAVAAAARFVGQRPFKELVFKPGLPWIYQFEAKANPDDATLIVLGDMGVIYPRNDQFFRDSQAALLSKSGTLSFKADPSYRLIDANGNPLPTKASMVQVPLTSNGFYLRTDGSKGSFAKLLKSVRTAKITGYPPVDLVLHDMLSPVSENPTVRVTVTNLLNRAVSGRLSVTLAGKTGSFASNIAMGPHTSKEISVKVPDLAANEQNLYAAKAMFDGGQDGTATHTEDLRVNLIAQRSITVDGDLSDWSGVLPQNLTGAGIKASLTEEAWLPFKTLDKTGGKTLSSGQLSYDEKGFYFASKTVDPTPSTGGVRYAARDDDSYFYPQITKQSGTTGVGFAVRWTGTVTPPTSGEYNFITSSDDGVRLSLNGKQVINNWSDHGPVEDRAVLRVAAGVALPIVLDYYQGGGGGSIKLEWMNDKGERSVIPASALSGGLKGTFFYDRDMQNEMGSVVSPSVDFSVGDSFPPAELRNKTTFRPLNWPEGVRRFSYRKDPDLPSGNGTDNVQIAFNVLPLSQKPYRSNPSGTYPRYMAYVCTDYEFALNSVAPEFGGGTEIWRLIAPGIPRKHFYPRQPKAPIDGGPLTDGKLVVKRDGNLRITEAFIPWSEIPDVKKALDAGKTIKFSFRINDNDGPAYELAQGRSVSKQNFLAFHNDWATHWANEIEFAFERRKQ